MGNGFEILAKKCIYAYDVEKYAIKLGEFNGKLQRTNSKLLDVRQISN